MGTLKRAVFSAALVAISVVFAILTLLNLAYILIRKGPKKMFYKKKRDEEPASLRDPVYGEHGYLHLEDVRIHYVISGPSEKPLMLLLHGFPESWYSWRHQIKDFSKDYRVVAIDMRGYGDSSRPIGIHNYKLECLVKDVKQIITALGYSSCILVGHDWGGAISWAFAGCYPEMVEKVIIMNSPHARVFKKYLQSHLAQFKKSWYMFFFLVPFLPECYMGLNDYKPFDVMFKGRKNGVQTDATTIEDVEVYKYLYPNRHAFTGPINYIRAGLFYSSSSWLSQKVTKPVLLIWGCRDLALETGLAECCKEYAYDMKIEYIEDSSHWVQMDHVEQVNSFMKEFITASSKTKA